MKYKKFELLPYRIHVIETDRFKKVTVKVVFKKQLEKEDITYRNMLIKLLFESSKKYPSKRDIAIHAEELYQTQMRAYSNILGNVVTTHFDCRFLNEDYTEKGMNQASLQFLFDLILDPDVENGAFREDLFELVKKQVEDGIRSVKDNPRSYASMRLLEIMAPDSSKSYRSCGYQEDLDRMDPKKVYEYYEKMIKGDIVNIFVIGNVNSDKIAKQIKEMFTINTVKRHDPLPIVEHKAFRKRVRNVTEPFDSQQSQLMIGFKMEKLTEFERQYVLPIYSHILGGGLDSLLFTDVREKNSLCYTIRSSSAGVSRFFFIRAGIDAASYKKAVKIIREDVRKMEKGEFQDCQIDHAIQNYLTSYQQLFDSEDSIIDNYVSHEFLNSDLIEKRIQNIQKVTKDMILKLVGKIHIDTIYLLEGEK